jgi:hypothetical protein
MDFGDFIGEFFLFGVFATPLISFLIVRKTDVSNIAKLVLGILITLLLGMIFLLLGFSIILRNGLGPDNVY